MPDCVDLFILGKRAYGELKKDGNFVIIRVSNSNFPQYKNKHFNVINVWEGTISSPKYIKSNPAMIP